MALYHCPCGTCDGEAVEVELTGGFAGTTATVAACSALAASGVVTYEVRRSAPLAWTPAGWASPSDEVVGLRHRDGLVSLTG